MYICIFYIVIAAKVHNVQSCRSGKLFREPRAIRSRLNADFGVERSVFVVWNSRLVDGQVYGGEIDWTALLGAFGLGKQEKNPRKWPVGRLVFVIAGFGGLSFIDDVLLANLIIAVIISVFGFPVCSHDLSFRGSWPAPLTRDVHICMYPYMYKYHLGVLRTEIGRGKSLLCRWQILSHYIPSQAYLYTYLDVVSWGEQ